MRLGNPVAFVRRNWPWLLLGVPFAVYAGWIVALIVPEIVRVVVPEVVRAAAGR